MAFVQTVRENFEGFSNKEITAAKLTCEDLGMIGHPSERNFKSMVGNNIIQNCSVTPSDVTSDNTIFCPNLAGARDKTVQQNMDSVVMNYSDTPKSFLKLHKFLSLVADMMILNVTPILITMSRGIKCLTVKHIPTRTTK